MRNIHWRCRACSARGYDAPGLLTFWLHWDAFHARRSIWDGTR